MFKFFIYMVFFIHLSACLCFAVVCNPGTDFKINQNETYTFPVTKHMCQPGSWVTTIASLYIISFDDATFYEVYSTCVYFAAATVFTVGYGDLHSASLRMDLLLTCLMVVGAVHFGWMVGVGTSILANANAARTSYSERVSSILHFLKSHNITGSIRNNILKYYDFKWIKTSGIDPETLFDYLPSSLLGDISTIVYADLITKVTWRSNSAGALTSFLVLLIFILSLRRAVRCHVTASGTSMRCVAVSCAAPRRPFLSRWMVCPPGVVGLFLEYS
ncbi:KCNH3 protein, partial [Polypterus senegalus]|nr:KCNH3 protein [Polypterus senegalus]